MTSERRAAETAEKSMKRYRVSVTRQNGRYTKTEYVTAASFDEDGKVLSVTMVGVRGGGHGYPASQAQALRDHLCGYGKKIGLEDVA